MTLKVGITGGIGAGKTTVCRLFETLGIPVYYADIRAKKLMVSDPVLKGKIKELLGKDAYFRNGRPNRKYIAGMVFNTATMLESLNQIVHPAVHEDFNIFCASWKGKVAYVLNEAALLVENGSYKRFDRLIVVTCPEDIRIARVMKRDKKSREEILKRLQNQLSEEEKVNVADYLIDNDGNTGLIPQVWAIHQKLVENKKT